MAKSSRASIRKKNNQVLKRKVFGPVEGARNDRLSSKLLELASQPKPPRGEMDVDEAKESEAKQDKASQDVDMDADDTRATRSMSSIKKAKANKAAKVEKRRHTRKPRNLVAFAKHSKKPSAKKR